EDAIALGAHGDEFDAQVRMFRKQLRTHMLGLPQGKRALTGTEAEMFQRMGNRNLKTDFTAKARRTQRKMMVTPSPGGRGGCAVALSPVVVCITSLAWGSVGCVPNGVR